MRLPLRWSVGLWALTWALVACPATLLAQGAPGSLLVTTGQGKVELRPTRAALSLAIETHAATAAQASAENGQKQRRVLAALAALGFAKDRVEPAGFSVSPNYDYEHRKQLVDYEARTEVKVRVDDLQRLGQVIDAALGAGGTEVRSITFLADSAEAGRRQALAQALDHARADAAALAAAAGGRLGRLVEASTIPPPNGGPLALQGGMAARSYALIAPEDVTVEVTVFTRWELAQ